MKKVTSFADLAREIVEIDREGKPLTWAHSDLIAFGQWMDRVIQEEEWIGHSYERFESALYDRSNNLTHQEREFLELYLFGRCSLGNREDLFQMHFEF